MMTLILESVLVVAKLNSFSTVQQLMVQFLGLMVRVICMFGIICG